MHPLIDLIAHLTVSHSLVLHLHRSTLSHRKIGRSTDSRIAPIDLTGLGRIAGILSLEVEDGNTTLDSLQHVGSELAMHVVATKPLFLRKDLVSSDALENERWHLRLWSNYMVMTLSLFTCFLQVFFLVFYFFNCIL
ncbi:uncharacterized protein LOC114286266 isoform X18 [Camellia sinensis]|uniref:uncharacterized protein LOC114286266 isoform X18 n=1 Tax=Camellia sinensis TaxID=4442 RepID=UPI00103589B5|nr:uncharacterized protein LOC114286266 isoform X18 [Camellia sinensis]